MHADRILINKNRGWRGLAELCVYNDRAKEVNKMIFSFSQPVWDDMQKGYIVMQDPDYYHVIHFDNTEVLPKGQRSVLIKYFTAGVLSVNSYGKEDWVNPSLSAGQYDLISHFIRNRNNHTTSDWNCIGIRVVPEI